MLRVTLCSTTRRLFAGTAERVVLPGEDGELAVLNFHAPLLCALAAGEVTIDDQRFRIRGGVARVARNAVTVLVS